MDATPPHFRTQCQRCAEPRSAPPATVIGSSYGDTASMNAASSSSPRPTNAALTNSLLPFTGRVFQITRRLTGTAAATRPRRVRRRTASDVRRSAQADATFAGFDVKGRVTVAEWAAGTLDLGAFFAMVSPEIDVSGNDNLPLFPPDRVGVSLEFTSDRLRANVDYVRASEQDDVAVRGYRANQAFYALGQIAQVLLRAVQYEALPEKGARATASARSSDT